MAFIHENTKIYLPRALQDRRHYYDTCKFDDMYLAVSTIPAIDLQQVASFFESGYDSFINKLFSQSGSGEQNLAHWIICTNGKERAVHLTLLPSLNNTKRGVPVILAEDLLTTAEKIKWGLTKPKEEALRVERQFEGWVQVTAVCATCGKQLAAKKGGVMVGRGDTMWQYLMQKPLYCPSCQRAYCSSCSHEAAAELGINRFVCPVCGVDVNLI